MANPSNVFAFTKSANGYAAPTGFTPVDTSKVQINNSNESAYSQYEDASGNIYNAYAGGLPTSYNGGGDQKVTSDNAWAANTMYSFLAPENVDPSTLDTPYNFEEGMKDIGSVPVGGSIFDASASGGATPYNAQ